MSRSPLVLLIVVLLVTACAKDPARIALQDQSQNFSQSQTPALDSLLSVHFINVGQGDAIFIRTPDKKNILIDAGPPSIDSVYQYLKKMIVDTLQAVILTHPHLDHYGGLDYLFRHMVIQNFYSNAAAAKDPNIARLISLIPVSYQRIVQKGDTILAGQFVILEVFSPPATPLSFSPANAVNENSLALKMTTPYCSLLFCGDISLPVESTLVSDYRTRLKADLLKVSHHGSRYGSDSTFLFWVQPQFAVIQTGPNSYGHPHPEALYRLRQQKIKTYRTDQDGQIIFFSLKDSLWISKL